MELDARLTGLHSDIDAHFDERKARLESERAEMHAWLDRLWPFLSKLPGIPSLDSVMQAEIQPAPPPVQLITEPPAPNGATGQKRKPFALRRAIAEIVDRMEDGAEITQHVVYDELLETYAELREHRPPNFRTQISSVLNWLANHEHRLGVVREGRGNNPHVYKKLTAAETAARKAAASLSQVGENS